MKEPHQHLKNFEHEITLWGVGIENQDEVSLVLWVTFCRCIVCSLKSPELSTAAPSITVCFYRLVQYQNSGFQSTSHVDIFQNLSKYCVLNLCLSLFSNGLLSWSVFCFLDKTSLFTRWLLFPSTLRKYNYFCLAVAFLCIANLKII